MSKRQGPSPHLSWAELACKDGTPYPPELDWHVIRILSEAFEGIRHRLGDRPIKILSAYRTWTHNKAAKGAPNSQHPRGTALDLKPPGRSVNVLKNAVLEEARENKHIRGVGVYPWGVHIDVRVSPRLVRWNGTRKHADKVTPKPRRVKSGR